MLSVYIRIYYHICFYTQALFAQMFTNSLVTHKICELFVIKCYDIQEFKNILYIVLILTPKVFKIINTISNTFLF